MPAEPKRAKAEVIQALRKAKGALYLAAEKLGVSAKTMRRYVKRWKEVAAVLREERGKMLDRAEGKLAAAVNKGDAWAVQFALSTIGRKRGYVKEKTINLNASEIDRAIEQLMAEVAGKRQAAPAAEPTAADQ